MINAYITIYQFNPVAAGEYFGGQKFEGTSYIDIKNYKKNFDFALKQAGGYLEAEVLNSVNILNGQEVTIKFDDDYNERVWAYAAISPTPTIDNNAQFYIIDSITPSNRAENIFIARLQIDTFHTYYDKAQIYLRRITACNRFISNDNLIYLPDLNLKSQTNKTQIYNAFSTEDNAKFNNKDIVLIVKIKYLKSATFFDSSGAAQFFVLDRQQSVGKGDDFTNIDLAQLIEAGSNIFNLKSGDTYLDAEPDQIFLVPNKWCGNISSGNGVMVKTRYTVDKVLTEKELYALYLPLDNLQISDNYFQFSDFNTPLTTPALQITYCGYATGEIYVRFGAKRVQIPAYCSPFSIGLKVMLTRNEFNVQVYNADFFEDVTDNFEVELIRGEQTTTLEKVTKSIGVVGNIIGSVGQIANTANPVGQIQGVGNLINSVLPNEKKVGVSQGQSGGYGVYIDILTNSLKTMNLPQIERIESGVQSTFNNWLARHPAKQDVIIEPNSEDYDFKSFYIHSLYTIVHDNGGFTPNFKLIGGIGKKGVAIQAEVIVNFLPQSYAEEIAQLFAQGIYLCSEFGDYTKDE